MYSSQNSQYYAKSLKKNSVKSKNIKILFRKCQQSIKESSETSSSTSTDLSSETAAEDAVQLPSTYKSVQPILTSISTQLTLTSIYVPLTLTLPIQPTSTSAVAIIQSSSV